MKLELHPIGYFKSAQIEPYQAARQPDALSENGQIILNSKNNFEQALQNLKECSHIWIIYYFHHNQNWKPLVQTPRSENKIGVFATRAPYRPNPIGLSVVPLISVDGLHIHVGPNDILDGTPILDIKPYHPESDVIEKSRIGWLDSIQNEKYSLNFSPYAQEQLNFLETHGAREISIFLKRQLEYDPLNSDKKRVQKRNDFYELSYRTWRANFMLNEKNISIISITSGYSVNDLNSKDDKYNDKELHRKFLATFN